MKKVSSHADDTAYRMICQRIVRALIEKYDWALLSEDELVELVLSSSQVEVSPAEMERLVKNHYTIALYEACRQANDLARRERGYHELFRFLFRAAYNRWPELAEDVTQRALVLVYEQIDRCQSPGTFLAFALGKLRHAFQQEKRARGRESPWEEMVQNWAERERVALSSYLDQQERCQVLLDAVQRLPKDLQRKAILYKFFGGLSDAEIGKRLGITAGYVRVLRHRGIARLRKDKHLRGYLKEKEPPYCPVPALSFLRPAYAPAHTVARPAYAPAYTVARPAYVVARIVGQRRNQPFVLGAEYVLQAGIYREPLPGFERVSISLPIQKEVELEVVVYAEDMHIEPDWVQKFVFRKGENSELLIFRLTPQQVGQKEIRVEFYYQQHWLAQIKFEVEVVETRELVPA